MGAQDARARAALERKGPTALALRSLDDMLRFAEQVVKAKLCAASDSAAMVAMKLQAGAELGFSPIQALSVMTAINGRVGIMGVGALARLRSSGLLIGQIAMGVDGEGDKRCGWIQTRRKNEHQDIRTEFTVSEAKRAGLWGKAGPWTAYPDDMLEWRAVGRHCKRHWSDVLLGVDIAETIDVTPITALPVREEAGPDPLLKALPESTIPVDDSTAAVSILERQERPGRVGYRCSDGQWYGTDKPEMIAELDNFVGTGELLRFSYSLAGSKRVIDTWEAVA